MNLKTVYQGAVRCEYAVRGRVVARAMELERKGREVVYCNIGNPQSLGQKPMTFARQVLSMVTYPELITAAKERRVDIPLDAVARAERYVKSCPGGSSGSYTHSAGIPEIREEVARFLKKRDGCDANISDIFLTDGASPAVQMLMRLLIRNPNDGVMVPVPRYPLYSALLDLNNGSRVDYFLDESNGWQLGGDELERSWQDARERGIVTRAVVVVNPGNPTGQVMDRNSLEDVVRFCHSKNLVLLADEVYQENIWNPASEFISFKKTAHRMGLNIELASFHSVSKGFFGECGRRGGFVEMSGFSQEVKDLVYKMASVNLCSNVDGQITVGLMCNPPQEGDPSHPLYVKERKEVLDSLKRRAQAVGQKLNDAKSGITCVTPEGALYAFPKVVLPSKFVAQRHLDPETGSLIPADEAYCIELLNKTGVVLVPGSGFGQRDGEFHFRTTILPTFSQLDGILDEILKFHRDFTSKHS